MNEFWQLEWTGLYQDPVRHADISRFIHDGHQNSGPFNLGLIALQSHEGIDADNAYVELDAFRRVLEVMEEHRLEIINLRALHMSSPADRSCNQPLNLRDLVTRAKQELQRALGMRVANDVVLFEGLRRFRQYVLSAVVVGPYVDELFARIERDEIGGRDVLALLAEVNFFAKEQLATGNELYADSTLACDTNECIVDILQEWIDNNVDVDDL